MKGENFEEWKRKFFTNKQENTIQIKKIQGKYYEEAKKNLKFCRRKIVFLPNSLRVGKSGKKEEEEEN